jgi:hypothetical protein
MIILDLRFMLGCEATGKQAFKKRWGANRNSNGASQQKLNQGPIAGIKILTLNL